jgi:hypothetical protein
MSAAGAGRPLDVLRCLVSKGVGFGAGMICASDVSANAARRLLWRLDFPWRAGALPPRASLGKLRSDPAGGAPKLSILIEHESNQAFSRPTGVLLA